MEHTRTITREFETGAKAVLHVETRSGAVTVESHDRDVVHVEAIVHVWSDIPDDADEAASLVERGLEQDAHRVIVRAPTLPQTEGWSLWGGKRGSRVDYMIRVPVTTAVRVLSRSGRVQIGRTEGRVHTEAVSGRLTVSDIRGDVTAVAKSGSITVERVEGNVSVEAKSGRIDVAHVSGTATIEARSGVTDLRDIGGEVKVTSHTGSLSMDDVRGAVKAIGHTGAIRYRGRVVADVELRAHTGMIQMAVDPQYPFFIEAESDNGAVHSDLPTRRGGPPAGRDGSPPPKVRLRTHTGTIRLTRA